MSQSIHITAAFDSGNINVIEAQQADNIRLAIRKDNLSDFYQWFHFKVHSQAEIAHRLIIENAADSAYVEGWNGYQAVASYDRQEWFRVETTYQDGQLVIEHMPEHEVVYYAYFAPYSYERHMDLLHNIQLAPNCRLEHLGLTLDGRDMTLAIIGDEQTAKRKVWVIGRQHPGETMAEWLIEGFLGRMLDQADPVANELLNNTVFYIVPNMNPDGSARGHLRTNAVGANLNREWQTPTMERSPEVFLVREKMLTTGVDLFLDIHGDEAIPYNFLAGCEGIPSYDEAFAEKQQRFIEYFLAASPDFQTEHGYPKSEPGQANMTMATTWVGEQFKCISFTLEMPFKDNLDLADPIYGWSPDRCIRLGEALCLPILHSLNH
jgi:murein tripeptide amidase MpaA